MNMRKYVRVAICGCVLFLAGCGGSNYKKCQSYGYIKTCTRPGCNEKTVVVCFPCRAVGDPICTAYCEKCGSGDHIRYEKMD